MYLLGCELSKKLLEFTSQLYSRALQLFRITHDMRFKNVLDFRFLILQLLIVIVTFIWQARLGKKFLKTVFFWSS